MTEQNLARVNVKDLPISTKWAIEISNFIRHKNLSQAKKQLEKVLEYKLAIPLRRFNFDRGHRKGNMGPGFYPQKSTKYILSLLNSAEANAEYKGLNKESLYIKEIIPNKGSTSWRTGRHGRRQAKRTNLNLVIEERKK